jgi:thioredoxin reductase (NADPH)
MRQLIIIGSGPAGYTAAIYAARASLNPLLIAGSAEPGGELMNTTQVDNFPGFPDGVEGPDLMLNMQQQAERFGTEILFEEVDSLELDGAVKRVHVTVGGRLETLEARSVVIASGSAYRHLGVPGETRQFGVSWCASCDGYFFKDKEIAVIGGGDSALEEATFLTRFASRVHVVHRRGTLRASKAMQQRAFADPKISFVWNSQVEAILGDEDVDGLALLSPAGERQVLPVEGVFVAIGSDPRTSLVSSQLELTAEGNIAVHGRSSKTSVSGVFAAGDVIDPHYKQAVTAAASGAVAALDVEHFLSASVKG